jgi:hypothetical protein
MVLVELVIAALILVVVILAVATFFVEHLRAFDRGKEQMELQRMGTLVMEGMVRAIREGSWVLGDQTGPSGLPEAIQIFYAGEPFFDTNRNGLYDSGEDFVDIYQRDLDGSTEGFEGIWNCASDGTGENPVPAVYFSLDSSAPEGGVILRGTSPNDCFPWSILVNDATRGSIWFDGLEFMIPSDGGDESVGIAFAIRNDLGTSDNTDDISMEFSSSVNLRE